jgi:excisionase family DNA binding protein
MKKKKKKLPVTEHKHLEFDAHLLESEKWLTTQGAMAHLKVSRSTIYRLRKKHNIPNFKLGRSPLYPKHLLNKYFIQKSIRNVKL